MILHNFFFCVPEKKVIWVWIDMSMSKEENKKGMKEKWRDVVNEMVRECTDDAVDGVSLRVLAGQ